VVAASSPAIVAGLPFRLRMKGLVEPVGTSALGLGAHVLTSREHARDW